MATSASMCDFALTTRPAALWCCMTIDKRQGAVFASGVLLGAVAVAGAWKKRGPAPLPHPEIQKATVPHPRPAPGDVKEEARPPRFVAERPENNVPPPQPAFGAAAENPSSAKAWPRQPWPESSVPAAAPQTGPTARQLRIFASCGVLAAACIASAWLLLDISGSTVPFSMPGKPVTTVMAPQASGLVATCPLEPTAAVAGSKDGQFPFQPEVPGLRAADIASFIVVGKDAVASNRPRDAEVAFLMSCRLADKLKGADSVESADGKFLLGAHYAKLALDAGSASGQNRPEMLKRAEFLYLDSLRVYAAAYGQADEKSRFAADGLAAVRRALAQGPASPPAAVAVAASSAPEVGPAPSPAAPSPPVFREGVLKPTPPAADESQEKRPGMLADASFDCSRARSAPEKMICSDAQLFQLNHQVAQMYIRARAAALDPVAFRRQNDVEARRRESICQDRGCLLRWYAYRRVQLTNEIQGRTQSPSMGWR